MKTAKPHPSEIDSTMRFDVTPYSAQGGYSTDGVVLALVWSITGALLVGVVAELADHWAIMWILYAPIVVALLIGIGTLPNDRTAITLYATAITSGAIGLIAGLVYFKQYVDTWLHPLDLMLIVFAAIMGWIAGLCSAIGVRVGKVRNVRLALVVGVLGGCVAFGAMRFAKYNTYVLENNLSLLDRSVFGTYTSVFGHYLLLPFEFAVAAIVAGATAAQHAASPFCTACNNWKKARSIGSMRMPHDVALQCVVSGDLAPLAFVEFNSKSDIFNVDIHECANCGNRESIDLTFSQLKLGNDGKISRTKLAQVTYPGKALAKIEALFTSKSHSERADPFEPRDRLILRSEDKSCRARWRLELGKSDLLLIDSQERILATIPTAAVSTRVVLPNGKNVLNIGILMDNGRLAWYWWDTKAVRKIQLYLETGQVSSSIACESRKEEAVRKIERWLRSSIDSSSTSGESSQIKPNGCEDSVQGVVDAPSRDPRPRSHTSGQIVNDRNRPINRHMI